MLVVLMMQQVGWRTPPAKGGDSEFDINVVPSNGVAGRSTKTGL